MQYRELTCVIIDDNTQKDECEFIKNKLKSQGYNIHLIFIHTNNPKALKKGRHDYETLKVYIEEQIDGKKLDVIATDFELVEGDNTITGLDIIDIFYKRYLDKKKKPKIILYSGKHEKVIKYIINKNTEQVPESEDRIINHQSKLPALLRKLMLYDIADFVERNDYREKIVSFCKELASPSLEESLLQKLQEHKEKELLFPEEFKGKRVSEIIKYIENNNPQGTDFLEQYTDLFGDYIIDVN